MFTNQIVPIAKIAIEHSEFHTLDYLLSELYNWMQGPDESVASDAAEIARLLIAAMTDDSSPAMRYVADVYHIHSYLESTLKWLENGKR